MQVQVATGGAGRQIAALVKELLLAQPLLLLLLLVLLPLFVNC
jgi:hypothetical protein